MWYGLRRSGGSSATIAAASSYTCSPIEPGRMAV
jgi:hypothetical protein